MATQRRPVSTSPRRRQLLNKRLTDSVAAPVMAARSSRDKGIWRRVAPSHGSPTLAASNNSVAARRCSNGAPESRCTASCDSVSRRETPFKVCLLYTSDAADDLLCVDLGGRRIIKKKKKKTTKNR